MDDKTQFNYFLKEYSDRLNTYDNINHEDQRHHEEADDEQMEANHENHEIDHESSHHHAKRTGIMLNHLQQHQHKLLLLKRSRGMILLSILE